MPVRSFLLLNCPEELATVGVRRALLRFGSMPLLGNHSVDAIFTGGVPIGEEKLEVQPPAKANDHGARNIARSSGVPIGQQLAILVHSSAILEFAGPAAQPNNLSFIYSNLVGIVQTLLFTSGVGFILASFFAMGFGTVIMNAKRAYFQPGYDEYGEPNELRVTPFISAGVNTYEMENNLYQLLERKKPAEVAWDIWALIIVAIVVGGLMLVFGVWLASIAPEQYRDSGLRYFGVFAAVGFVVFLFQEIRHRLHRNR